MKVKGKHIQLVIGVTVCIIFVLFAILMVALYNESQGQICANKRIAGANSAGDDRIFRSAPKENERIAGANSSNIEEFKLYKFCHLYDKVKNLQQSIYNSSTISIDDNRVLNEMCSFIDDKLSAIQHSSCGKYLCMDDISDEHKLADCTRIDGGDVSVIMQKLTEIKMYIKKLSVADEQNYTRRIEKIMTLLQNIETP